MIFIGGTTMRELLSSARISHQPGRRFYSRMKECLERPACMSKMNAHPRPIRRVSVAGDVSFVNGLGLLLVQQELVIFLVVNLDVLLDFFCGKFGLAILAESWWRYPKLDDQVYDGRGDNNTFADD